MLEKVLAVSGKPGLYLLLSRGNSSLVVETIDSKKRRMPVFGADKVIALADIAMYTDDEEVPLRQVLKNIFDKEGGKVTDIDYKKASKEELAAFMAEVLPKYDRDRVRQSDMRKLISWYNVLVSNGITDFEAPKEEPKTEE